eukprot:UC4_evm6s1370
MTADPRTEREISLPSLSTVASINCSMSAASALSKKNERFETSSAGFEMRPRGASTFVNTTSSSPVSADPSLPNLPSNQIKTGNKMKRKRHLSSRLSAGDSMFLSPWQKWKKHKRFPFKLSIHILICTVVMIKLLTFNEITGPYINDIDDLSRKMLGGAQDPDLDALTAFFYTTNSLNENLNSSLNNFFSMGTSGRVGFFTPEPSVDVKIEFYNKSKTSITFSDSPSSSSQSFELSNSSILDASMISVEFRFNNSVFDSDGNCDQLYSWEIETHYDMSTGGGVANYRLRIRYIIRKMHTFKFLLLAIILIVLSFTHTVLYAKKLFRQYNIMLKVRSQLNQTNHRIGNETMDAESDSLLVESIGRSDMSWSDLSWFDKLCFFSAWDISTVISNIMLIVGMSMTIPLYQGNAWEHMNELDARDATISIGIFGIFCNLCKYAKWDLRFYVLILGIKACFMKIIRFVICVTPLYIGYALVGVSLFSNCESTFGNITYASMTLFSLLHGDSMLMIFKKLCNANDANMCNFAQLYLYTFITLFITTILNVFIFIIESGYEIATEYQRQQNNARGKKNDNGLSRSILQELIKVTEDRNEKAISGRSQFALNTENLDGDISNFEIRERMHKLEFMQVQLLEQMKKLDCQLSVTSKAGN